MLQSLRSWFTPPTLYNDEQDRIVTLTSTILMLTIIASIVGGTAGVLVSRGQFINMIPSITIIVLEIIVMFILRRGYVQTAAWAMVSILWVGLVIITALIGGLNSATISLLVVMVMIAALTTGERGNYIFTAGSIIAVSIFYLVEQFLGTFPTILMQTTTNIWVTALTALFCAGIFLNVALRELTNATHVANLRRKELQIALDVLQETSTSSVYMDDILQSMLDMLIVLDNDLCIKTVNQSLCQTLGYTPEALNGKPFEMLLGDDVDDLMEQLRLLRDGKPADVMLMSRFRTQTDDNITVYVRANLMLAGMGTARVVCIAQDLTDLLKMQQDLAEERNLLRTLIDTLPDMVYVKDVDRRFVVTNKKHVENFGQGLTAEEITGKRDEDVTETALIPIIAAEDAQVLKGQPLVNFPSKGVIASGEERDLLITKVPLTDPASGSITGLLAVIRDVTEQVEAELELAYERNLLRTILDSLPDYVLVKNTEGQYVLSNRAHMEAVGVTSQAEIVGKTSVDLFGTDVAQPYVDDDRYVLTTGESLLGVERKAVNNNGEEIWVLTNKVPLQSDNGAVQGIVAIATDITDRRHAEEALRDSEARNRALLSVIPDLMFVLDENGRHIEVKGEYPQDVVIRVEDIVTLTVYDIFPDDTLGDRYIEAIRACLETGALQTFSYDLETFMGNQHFEARLAKLNDNEVVSIVRDMTEQHNATERIRRNEKMYRTLIHNLPRIAVMLYDTDLRFIIAEGGPLVENGYLPKEVEGRTLAEVLPPEDLSFFDERYRRALAGETINYERAARNGRHYSTTIVPIYTDEQEIMGGLIVVIDVTEDRWQAQELLQYAEALERSNRELQDFAYVASHDLQEPLRKIQAFGDRLAQRAGDDLDPTAADYLARMQNAAGRMQTLIQDLLSFSRVTTKAQPFQLVDLDRVVREVLTDLELRIEQSDATITVPSLPKIAADPVQMRQLFQNLIGNALKYTQEGVPPIITIDATQKTLEDDRTVIEIKVTDNGIGFSDRHAERIFGLFQRLHSRNQYQGTGMGLAICRKIAERHDGTLHATGVEGQGATFTLQLPTHAPKHRMADVRS